MASKKVKAAAAPKSLFTLTDDCGKVIGKNLTLAEVREKMKTALITAMEKAFPKLEKLQKMVDASREDLESYAAGSPGCEPGTKGIDTDFYPEDDICIPVFTIHEQLKVRDPEVRWETFKAK